MFLCLKVPKVGYRSGQSRHEVMHMVPGHSQGTFVGGRAIATKVDTEPGSLATPEKKVTGAERSHLKAFKEGEPGLGRHHRCEGEALKAEGKSCPFPGAPV